MSIDEVIEKTTIDLPIPLGLRKTEELFYYIAEQLPANIHYFLSNHRSIIHNGEKGILTEDGTLEISANILNTKTSVFDTFKLKSNDNDEDTSKLSVINFQRVPGWVLSDYRPEVRELWEQVREVVGKYFERS